METWIWLLLLDRIIAGTCPFTSKIGSVLNLITAVAVPVFCLLCFFFAQQWWYGLIALGLYFLVPIFIPKIDGHNVSNAYRVYSGIFSHANILVVILMYLSLFEVI